MATDGVDRPGGRHAPVAATCARPRTARRPRPRPRCWPAPSPDRGPGRLGRASCSARSPPPTSPRPSRPRRASSSTAASCELDEPIKAVGHPRGAGPPHGDVAHRRYRRGRRRPAERPCPAPVRAGVGRTPPVPVPVTPRWHHGRVLPRRLPGVRPQPVHRRPPVVHSADQGFSIGESPGCAPLRPTGRDPVRVGRPWSRPSTTAVPATPSRPAPSGPPGAPHTTSKPRSRCSAPCCCRATPSSAAIEICGAGRLLQAGPRAHLRRHRGPLRAGRAGRRGHGRRRAAPVRPARGRRRPGHAGLPAGQHPVDRQRRPLRPASSRSTPCSAGWSGWPARSPSIGYSVPEDVAGAVDRAEPMVFDVAQRRVTDTIEPLAGPARTEPRPHRGALPNAATPSPACRPATSTSTSTWPGLQPVEPDHRRRPPGHGQDELRPGHRWPTPAMRRRGARPCSSPWRWATSSSPSACWPPRPGSTPTASATAGCTSPTGPRSATPSAGWATPPSTSTTTPT